MSDIFISYAKGDHGNAAALAAVLEARGWSVWWDRQIPPGRTFDEVIEEALTRARCVIVLWSAESAGSRWVRTEASVAAERGILVPALIEDVAIPLEFRRVQAARLVGWFGDEEDHELARLLDTCARLVSATGAPEGAAAPVVRNARPRALYGSPGFIAALLLLAAFAGGATLTHYLEREERGGLATGTAAGEAPATAGTDIPARADAAPAAAADEAGGAPSTSPVSPAAPAPAGRINLLSQRNGGHLVAAPNESLLATNDDNEGFGQLNYATGSEAVYAFKDEKAATFDAFEMFIADNEGGNVAEFELLAGNDAPLGEFQSIGTFRTQNVRLFPSAWQTFAFAPVRAKFLKVRIVSTHRDTRHPQVFEWRLMGSF